MPAYYNEFDPAAAAWLRELIGAGLIAPGEVDERSIKDVQPDDLRGYEQCHFFAGIGVWSHALRRAGWADERPVWTGSCPCQPFSPAGKGLGFEDPRHLWPDWLRLIAECRPDRVFGEQSAAAGLWVDLVRADLEARHYAFGCPDLPAAGFAQGAHIRQRFYWVADADDAERWADMAPRNVGDWPATGRVESYGEPGAGGDVRRLAHGHGEGRSERSEQDGGPVEPGRGSSRWPDDGGRREVVRLGDGDRFGEIEVRRIPAGARAVRARGVLEAADWLLCRDDRWRPVEAGTLPLADARPERVGLLRGYGNALDAETAASFVSAFMEAAEMREFLQ
jgi:DNA (cytosine-5)-methyltransferase 1